VQRIGAIESLGQIRSQTEQTMWPIHGMERCRGQRMITEALSEARGLARCPTRPRAERRPEKLREAVSGNGPCQHPAPEAAHRGARCRRDRNAADAHLTEADGFGDAP
jgi:hypothetical protein